MEIAGNDYPYKYGWIEAVKYFIRVYKEEKIAYGDNFKGLYYFLVSRIDFIRLFHNKIIYPLKKGSLIYW